MWCKRPPPAKGPANLVSQTAVPGERPPRVAPRECWVFRGCAGVRTPAFFGERPPPDFRHPPLGAVPAENSERVPFQQRVERFRSEPPVVVGIGVDVEIER